MANRQTKSVAIDIGICAKCERAAAVLKMPTTRWINMILDQQAESVIKEGRPISGAPDYVKPYRNDDWNEMKPKDHKISRQALEPKDIGYEDEDEDIHSGD